MGAGDFGRVQRKMAVLMSGAHNRWCTWVPPGIS